MSAAFTIFLVSFFKIAARAFQQKNVMHDNWFSIIPISYIMATLELAVVGISATDIINNGYSNFAFMAIAYGTGGWMGAWFAIWLHARVFKC